MALRAITLRLSAILLIGACTVRAQVATATWSGGTSNWNNSANWTPAVVPNNQNYNVDIPTGAVSLDTSETINLLNITTGASLTINNTESLVLAGASTQTIGGTLSMGSTGNYTYLGLFSSGGTFTLSGGGTLSMSNSSVNTIYGLDGNEIFVNQITIQGAG